MQENGFNNGGVKQGGSSSSLQYCVDRHGDLVYYNKNGWKDDDVISGWVHVFLTDDTLEAKTPSKKAQECANDDGTMAWVELSPSRVPGLILC